MFACSENCNNKLKKTKESSCLWKKEGTEWMNREKKAIRDYGHPGVML